MEQPRRAGDRGAQPQAPLAPRQRPAHRGGSQREVTVGRRLVALEGFSQLLEQARGIQWRVATTERFEKSEFARAAFGDKVVDHYSHFFRVEQEAWERAVTDWDRRRYFVRI